MPICNLATASVGPANLIDTLLGGSGTPGNIAANAAASANLNAIWSLPVATETNAYGLKTTGAITLPLLTNSVICSLAVGNQSSAIFASLSVLRGHSAPTTLTGLSSNQPSLTFANLSLGSVATAGLLNVDPPKAHLLTVPANINAVAAVTSTPNVQLAMTSTLALKAATSGDVTPEVWMDSIVGFGLSVIGPGGALRGAESTVSSKAAVTADLLLSDYMYAGADAKLSANATNGLSLIAVLSVAQANCAASVSSANLSIGFIGTAAPAIDLPAVRLNANVALSGAIASSAAVNTPNLFTGWLPLSISAAAAVNTSNVVYGTLALGSTGAYAYSRSIADTGTATAVQTLKPVDSRAVAAAFNLPIIGANFTVLRGMVALPTAISQVNAPELTKAYTFVQCVGSVDSTAGTSTPRLNIALTAREIATVSAVKPIDAADILIGKTYALLPLYIDGKAQASVLPNGAWLMLGLQGIALGSLASNTPSLSVGMIGSIAAASTSQSIVNMGVRRWMPSAGINAKLVFDTTNTYITKTHELKSNVAGIGNCSSYYESFMRKLDPAAAAGALAVFGGVTYPNGARLTLLNGTTALPVNAVTAASSLGYVLGVPGGPALLAFGSADYPTQLLEYARYSLPTGTSLATAVDNDNNPVYASNSVFGATLIRVNPGANSTAAVSARVRATQLGPSDQYAQAPSYNSTLVLLRASRADTTSVQRALFGTQAVGTEVERVADYANFPRSYYSSVGSMGSTGNSTLANPAVFSTGTYAAPTTPILFFGSSLIRHNYNQGVATTENVAVATDYYYPDTNSKKLAKARVESTVSNNSEGVSPIYSAPAFRLLTPAQYAAYSSATGKFKANAAVLPQDGATPAAHVHGSDSMFTFVPMKDGAKYAYSYYHPSSSVNNANVAAAEFLGGDATSYPLEFTVALTTGAGAVLATDLYSPDADCVLRMTLYPYTGSGTPSFVYVDIPVIGISVNDSTRVVVDSSYRWYLEQCLPGRAYYSLHGIRSLKDYYSAPNSANSITSKAIVAVTRPVVSIAGDQGESSAALLSAANDRNLVMGEFSLAISRPDTVISNGVAVNVEATDSSALSVYSGASGAASKVSSFDPNSLHLFIKADGTLAGRRKLTTYTGGATYTSNINAVLSAAVLSFIASAGTFSKVKVGENIIALLSSGATGKKLFLWGANTYGQLDVPKAVDPDFAANGYIADVKDFDFHAGHVAVIKDNGKLYGWGCKASTVWRTSGTAVKYMDVGKNYMTAIVERTDPDNPSSTIDVIEQYGNISAAPPAGITIKAPTQVWAPASAGQTIYAGKVLACGENHTVFLKSDGTVACWGNNTYGQCTVPGGLTSIIAVDAGDNHTIALKSDGTVYAWGRNNYGQTTIPSGLNAKIISAGGDFCAAIRSSSSTDVSAVVGSISDEEVEDTIACWGRNDKGQCTVPTCEGVSYDASVYKYRMRFWSVQCGWDHAVGIRKNATSAKWARDHQELTRYVGRDLIKMPLKTSGGTTIFSCIREIIWSYSNTASSYVGQTTTGVQYATTIGVDNNYYTSPVTVGSVKYRLKAVPNYGSSVIFGTIVQRSVSPYTSWTDLTFNTDTYDYLQNYTASSINQVYPDLYWNALGTTPTWDVWTPTQDVNLVRSAQTTGEYVGLDYSAADVNDPQTNKRFVAWGNPMAFTASVDLSDYQPYYSSFPDTQSALAPDLVEAAAYQHSAEPLYYSFSYVGAGVQLGKDIYTGGLGGSWFADTALNSPIYLGPKSLQATSLSNEIVLQRPSVGSVYYGHPAVYLDISGTPRFFNTPTAFSSTKIKTLVTPERNTFEFGVIGFNNAAVYVEEFGYSLPSGYSIVANGHASLPAGTRNSATGYHVLWSGTISSVSVKLVMTGAYVDVDYSNSTGWAIRLPFDDNYANYGIPDNYETALGLTKKYVRVVKHQLDVSAANRVLTPIKHATFYSPANGINSSTLTCGLSISASSYQRSGDVLPMTTGAGLNVSSVAGKHRSVMVIRKSTSTVGGKSAEICYPMGDNTQGQLSLKLVDSFGLNSDEFNYSATLSSSWLMDFGQANIGHTQTPSLAYGYTQVSCGQFHTLAIDDSGAVSAWGLNYGINAPKSQFMIWDPFAFGGSNCSLGTPGNQAYVTGYFTTLSGEPSGAAGSNFNLNRAVAVWPAGYSSSRNLDASNKFVYPDVPIALNGYDSGCYGSYTTSGTLLFDSGGFNDPDVVLVNQLVSSGPGLVIGLKTFNGQSRVYVTTTGSSTTYYSDPYVGPVKLVHLHYPDNGPNSDISVRARINGAPVTWNLAASSPSVRCVPYRSFMGCVGDTSAVELGRNKTISRVLKPVTGITKMWAGDTAFGGIYSSETDPVSVIRGTVIARNTDSVYSYVVGFEINGPALPALDIDMPNDYVITKVSRTYYNSTTATNTAAFKHVVVAYPFSAIFSFNAALLNIPASIKARSNGTNFTSTEVAALENVVDIAAGTDCFFAIKNSSPSATQGSLVAWSDNVTTLYYDGLSNVPAGSNYVAVAARGRHAAALKADGSIVCWGINTHGESTAPAGTGYTAIACGETFNAAIDSSGKLKCWGTINTVPAPYSNMTFSTVSCGKGHVVATVGADYSENVPGGVFKVKAGDVIAFGDNSKGQCNIPGFSYGPNNAGINGAAAAGGDFTAFECNTSGFKATEYTNGSIRTFAFTDMDLQTPSTYSTAYDYLYKLEGYVIHRAGALCPPVLDKDHPWALNPPASVRTPANEAIYETIQSNIGYTPVYSRTSNATNVPAAFRRGGTKKAKLVAAGRHSYYKQGAARFPYGAGYGIIVGEDNQITVFGGDLLPTGCNVASYSPPAESLALRDLSLAGLAPDDTLIQLDTFRGQVFALKSSGDLVRWGYDDVSTTNNPEFYRINTVKKQNFSVPDDSLRDALPRIEAADYSNFGLSYVSGIPGFNASWAVDVFLDRYFNGVKTNIRRFTATGKTPEYSIQNAVHFAETFLAVDTWPGTATGLDTQYVMSVVPYGVSCTINSASMFLLNLDSKTAGNVRVLNDASAMPSDLNQVADFMIVNNSGTGFASNPMVSVGSVDVTAVADAASAITLTSSNAFTYPSYVRNSYGSSARLEYLSSGNLSARVGGRVANPVTLTPGMMSADCWYSYTSLPSSTGAAISSWANSISGGTALAQSTANLQANVQTFNTTYRGAEFDTTTSQQDRMFGSAATAQTAFTYFLVLKKSANTAGIHCAFGKYINPGLNQYKVQGIGFSSGQPVLFYGGTHDVATTSIGTGNTIVCGYVGGGSYNGIRVNGTAVTSYASTAVTSSVLAAQTSGYYLGSNIISGNFHDSNDVYAEVVAFDRALTLAEIQIVEGYLNNKFGLSVLPGGHPYQTQPAARDTLTQLYNEGLDSEHLLLESNRLVNDSGKGETWLGMFEVGLNHRGVRAATQGDNHAPILAEFDVLINDTIGAMPRPIVAVASTSATLTVDSHTKYLAGQSSCAATVNAPAITKVKTLAGSSQFALNTTATAAMRLAIAGTSAAKLQFFGGTDCDSPYGCLGVSELPPDLIVRKAVWVTLPVAAKATATASLSRRVIADFVPYVTPQAQVSGSVLLSVGLFSNISAAANVSAPTLKYVNTDIGLASIRAKSKVLVCLPDMLVKGPSSAKKTQIPIYKPDAPIDVGGPIMEGPGYTGEPVDSPEPT